MSDSPYEPRAKRLRADKGGRLAAFEKLKKLKGSKHKCDVADEVDNVYELIDEKDYAKKAKEMYDENWIEDDGTGYAEDGRDFFEDEDFLDEDAAQNLHQRKGKKRPRDSEKSAKGRGSIRNLFKNAIPKKGPAVELKNDEVLADILEELDDDPKASRDITATASSSSTTLPAQSNKKYVSKNTDAIVAKEYMNKFLDDIKANKKAKNARECSDDELLDGIMMKSKPEQCTTARNVEHNQRLSPNLMQPPMVIEEQGNISRENVSERSMDFSCLHEEDNQFELEKDEPLQPKVIRGENAAAVAIAATAPVPKSKVTAVEIMDDYSNLLSDWESTCSMDNFEQEMQSTVSEACNSVGQLQDEMRFWYWEAYEEADKRPGEIFLFGRMLDGRSVCVRVDNIDRVLYLLPYEYLRDNITKEPTKRKVSIADVYKEFDGDIATVLELDNFRSRKITKNFANHSIGVNVPQVCDYLEIHYDGKKPVPEMKKQYNSIAHIFGCSTTALERFLVANKIKGPCWLSIKQYRINAAPMSWCKLDLSVSDPKNVCLAEEAKRAPPPPPPLTLLTINTRTTLNPTDSKHEVAMISMLVHNRFHVDRPAPEPPFNRHMCGFTRPATSTWPLDLNSRLATFKTTQLTKHDSERALLSWFLAQYQQIDADLVVSHDIYGCQLDILADRIVALKIPQWSRLGRLRFSQSFGRKLLQYFSGRMVCDVKRSAEECLRSRSYDLETLCVNVLKLKEGERMDVTEEDLHTMYESVDGVLKLITLTMKDASYVLRLMCELNIMPLALQITNICGNTMTRTLQGGRSERNEFLLVHSFTERNYIVPDKVRTLRGGMASTFSEMADATAASASAAGRSRRKAAYSGGLVLEPLKGLYDSYVLLLDFNSLYPSIIQEYNICFTTVRQPDNMDELPQLPDASVEPGILPQQLRRLVESRREVKKLMSATDISPELQMQYNIRQMALKLTANSMYGCLGFAHSRFFAQHLAALVTHKGREILTNTKGVVQKLNYQVVYGDTDSIMVNTNSTDYDQVIRIGQNIKQSVNKMYKQLELDIDGVFCCLLLLKKKKYAAVKLTKDRKGELRMEQEHKGLDIVRRDWSQLAIMVGKVVLDEILSEKQLDEKIASIHSHLEKIKVQMHDGSVPMPMFVITKQLSKAPTEFNNITTLPHVQVALRMNMTRNRRYKMGDMVNYVICSDGTANAATQRAYHLDEVKKNDSLQLDLDYYLAHQIHPVVTRLVEVLDGTDASRIAEYLGLDPSKFRSAVQRSHQERSEDAVGESLVKTALQRYRLCEKFKFVCISCKAENIVAAAFRPAAANQGYVSVLQSCVNTDCTTPPYQYVASIRNQLALTIRRYVARFYQNWLVCDDSVCNQNTRQYSHVSAANRPVCVFCRKGSLVRQYTERDLYDQLSYFQYIFDLSRHQHKNATLSPEAEAAYSVLCNVVEQQMEKSAYCTISMADLFSHFRALDESDEVCYKNIEMYEANGI